MFEARQITYDEVGEKEAQMFADTFSGIELHFGSISIEQYRARFEQSKDSGLTGLFHDEYGLVAILKYVKAIKTKTAYTTDIMKINFSEDTGWLIRKEAQEVLLKHSKDQGYDVVVICGIHSSQEAYLRSTLNSLDIVESVTQQTRGDFLDIYALLGEEG